MGPAAPFQGADAASARAPSASPSPVPGAAGGARQPLIGVTGHHLDSGGGKLLAAGQAYLAAVWAAGGVPVVIPPLADRDSLAVTLAALDGVLFTGGKDVDPQYYGEPILNDTVSPEPERDAFELPLAREAVARDLPVLAICRGCQVLTVALGGTLWQDLPAQRPDGLLHAQRAPRHVVTHAVHVAPGTLLARVLGEAATAPIQTNTFHHQAARAVPPCLVTVAQSADGAVEAIEAPGRRFVLGVQWHPEHLAASRPEHHRLFAAFIAAARPDGR